MYRVSLLVSGPFLLLLAAGCGLGSTPLVVLGLPTEPPGEVSKVTGTPAPPANTDCGPVCPPPEVACDEIESVSTVLNPGGLSREITLAECIALALENGRTGQLFDQAGSGRRSSVSGVAPGGPAAVSDSVRVLACTPAILGTDIEQSLSRFDLIWQSGFGYNHYDEPVGLNSIFPSGFPGLGNSTVQGIANGLSIFNTVGQQDTADFRTQLIKPLPSGGTAGISFQTDYYNLPNNGANLLVPFVNQPIPLNNPFVFSPAYRPQMNFTFEQPLLQGFGVFTNDVRDTHPGSLRNPFNTNVRAPGILLARVTYEQSKLEFKRQIHELLFAVESAYWELYGAYWSLYSREVGMRQALAAWQIAKQKYDKGGLPLRSVNQIEQQYQNFRIQRLQALGDGASGRAGVLEAERRLRYVMGLPAEDGARLIPCNMPSDTPLCLDWKAAVAVAREQRPELVQIQQEIQAAQLAVRRAEDLRLPELRYLARYNINGLGQTLGSALDNFAQARYDDWDMGLLLQVPIGLRLGNAEVTRAKLKLQQRFAYLRDQEAKVVLSMQRSYRDVIQIAEEIRLRRLRRSAAESELAERYKVFQAGGGEEAALNILLEAQRNWIETLRDEQLAICNYNVALADFEWQKGTILDYDNVQVAEGPLPAYAQDRASKHIRQFKRSLTLWPISGDHDKESANSSGPEVLPKELLTTEKLCPLPVLLSKNESLPEQLAQACPLPPTVAAAIATLPPPPPETPALTRLAVLAPPGPIPETLDKGAACSLQPPP